MSEYIKKEDALDKIVEQLPQRAYMKCQKAIDSLPTYSFPEREKGTDLISREAVIDLLNQFGYYDKEMERDLSAIPSAIPEREKGTDGTLVYNADGHFYGVMGGDAIMERMRGKAE